MKQGVFGVSLLAMVILFSVPACAQQPTAAQRVETDARIAAELAEVEAQVKDAEAQDAKLC